MFTLQDYVLPDTLEKAYSILNQKKSNTILGGCAFLKLGSKRIGTGIDLSALNLDYISENEGHIEIGAMATLRDVETNTLLNRYFEGILSESVKNIVGVQLRDAATVGGTVFSKYGFSDLITALLALNADVLLYKGGQVALTEFLKGSYEKDILIKVIIKKSGRKASFKMIRNSMGDYAILNAAVSREGNNWRIVAGARPKRAEVAKEASHYLCKDNVTVEDIEYASELACRELSFGSNMRASEEYRRAVCKVLIKRAAMEVLS